jgi:hypothetical protein
VRSTSKDMLESHEYLVKSLQRRPKHGWEGSIKINLQKMAFEDIEGLSGDFFK